MPASNDLRNQFLNSVFRGDTLTTYPTLWLALLSSSPAAGSLAGEFAASLNYARPTLNMAEATAYEAVNAVTINFNQASGVWGTIAYFAAVNTSVPGTGIIRWWNAASSPTLAVTGGLYYFNPGALKFQVT